MVLSLGLPKDTSDEFLENLMKGADKCATQYGTSIIGGDTKENPNVMLCGTAFGIVKKNEFMGRKGAKPGDIVAVTGTLGKAAAEYYAFKHNVGKKNLKGLLEPEPRLEEGIMLAKAGVVTSCMDISDGLSSSLYQLQELNDVGFKIDEEKIPQSQELLELTGKIKTLNVHELSIHFGGDYELLLTISPDKFEKAQKIVENTGNQLTPIGIVTKDDKIVIISNGIDKVLENKGYEHFKENDFW